MTQAAATATLPRHGPDGGSGRVAVFDLDRTLLPGSSLVALARSMVAKGLMSRRRLVGGLVREAAFRRRGATDAEALQLRDQALGYVEGLDARVLDSLLADVGRRLAKQVRPAAAQVVRRHLVAGDFVIVLSASPQPLVEAVAASVGAHRAVGTRACIADGRYTGTLDGPFCYGVGKLARLHQDIGADVVRDAAAYADSISDLPLLQACRTPVVVNPDRALRDVAARRGWSVVSFR